MMEEKKKMMPGGAGGAGGEKKTKDEDGSNFLLSRKIRLEILVLSSLRDMFTWGMERTPSMQDVDMNSFRTFHDWYLREYELRVVSFFL